jgi:MFS family permease
MALFVTYLAVAMPLPVLSLYAKAELGLDNWLGGLAVGCAFISTLISRPYAGNAADRFAKPCAVRGVWLYFLASGVCLLSGLNLLPATLRYGILVIGRLLLGVGESYTMVGMISWCIAVLGPENSGKVISVVGMSLYGSLAAGGPLGLFLYKWAGFKGLMFFSLCTPLIGYAIMRGITADEMRGGAEERQPLTRIVGHIWQCGAAICLQGVGFAVIGAFFAAYFLSRGWPSAGMGLSAFGGGFVLVRLLFGWLPDKKGGWMVTVISLIIEATGQYLLWGSQEVWQALVGAFLTGLGCSLVFPSLGVEVIRRVEPESRGLAVGLFAAFQDLSYAISAPLTGLLADHFGYPAVFLAGGISATAAIILMLTAGRPKAG